MKLSRNISLGLILSLLVPTFTLASSTSPIHNANVNADYAFTMIEDEIVDDFSDILAHSDGDTIEIFNHHEMEEDRENYLVLGVRTPFDEVYFDTDNAGHFEETSFDWEYNDGGSWKNLSLDVDTTDDFESSGDSRIEFDLPDNWDEDTLDGNTAYWVRYGGSTRMDESPAMDQVSMRAYNLEFNIEDDEDDEITSLNESDFTVDRGSDDEIYGFKNEGSGVYWLALNGDETDTNYTVTIEDYRYHERSVDTGSLSSSLNSFGITLYDLDDDEDDDDDDWDDEDEDADYDVNDDRELIDGATADFDYVYHRGNRTINYTDEASENDNDHVEVFRDSSGTQYLYLGMRTVFDEIYFDVDQEMDWDGSSDLDWEYYSDDHGWEDLDVDDHDLDDFEDEDEVMVDFDIPHDWEEYRFEGHEAYWVRIRARYDVDEEAEVDQISARAYTLHLEVEDDDKDEVDNLKLSDFDLSKGSDNEIYGFINDDDGDYLLAINVDASDINYELTIVDEDYYDEEFSVRPRTSQASYDVELRERSSRSSSSSSSSYDYEDCYVPFRDVRYHWSRYSVEELYCMGIVEGKSTYVFDPNDDVSRAEFLKMLLEIADVDLDDYEDDSESFRDVREYDWYYEYVVAALELDVIQSGSYFNPNSDINRAEAVAMMSRLAELDLDERTNWFTDVGSYNWYSVYVRAAYDANLVNGFRDGTFRPEKDLSRAEATEMIMNAYEENIW